MLQKYFIFFTIICHNIKGLKTQTLNAIIKIQVQPVKGEQNVMGIKSKRGITLVALVVTIIILLIIAGISVQVVTQANIFNKIEKTKNETNNAQIKENETLSGYTDSINEYLPEMLSYKVKNGEIEIGAYINYKPDLVATNNEKYKSLISNLSTYSGNTDEDENTSQKIQQEELKWRVLDVKDGHVRLVSENPTEAKIRLENYNGYNNGVKLLDDTCSTLYNSAKLANKVQNLKIEDIQDKMKEKYYTKFRKNYGKIFITQQKYYPSILLKEQEQEVTLGEKTINGIELGLSEQTEYIEQREITNADILKVKYTLWDKDMEEEDFYDNKYYNLFISNENNYLEYWLSSRCITANSEYAHFDIRCVSDSGRVGTGNLYYSGGVAIYSYNYAYRPVITLNSNVQIDAENSGEGTKDIPYNIK